MSLHDELVVEIKREKERLEELESPFISPSGIAVSVYCLFKRESDDPHVSYLSIEQLKQMSRQILL